ncbi:MAG: nucleotidyltransferase domain-containing protein [Nitrospirae bacterium]|nr:nucleotidyltransferase domain-containing protein [Fimbriimonadaceae bacterium]
MRREQALERLRQHRSELEAKYGIVRIGLFGSVARDDAGDSSDVDVVVRLAKPDLFGLVALREELSELLEASVDLVHEHERLRPLLAKRIAKDVIYV